MFGERIVRFNNKYKMQLEIKGGYVDISEFIRKEDVAAEVSRIVNRFNINVLTKPSMVFDLPASYKIISIDILDKKLYDGVVEYFTTTFKESGEWDLVYKI